MQKTVTVTIGENDYEVGFPNTGQLIDIRAMKSRLTEDIRVTESVDGYAVLLGEMASHFTIMIPKLKKDLNTDSIFTLSLIESKVLVDAYVDNYRPFFDEWMNFLMAPKASKEVATKADA